MTFVRHFSFANTSLENISKYSGSPMSGNSPVLSSSSSQSRGHSVTRARVTCLTGGTCPGSPSEDCAQYGSVLLDIVTGTAHWSPEAPRRAITPDRQNIAMFQGRARHCKHHLIETFLPHRYLLTICCQPLLREI